jgi:hypothetical protein
MKSAKILLCLTISFLTQFMIQAVDLEQLKAQIHQLRADYKDQVINFIQHLERYLESASPEAQAELQKIKEHIALHDKKKREEAQQKAQQKAVAIESVPLLLPLVNKIHEEISQLSPDRRLEALKQLPIAKLAEKAPEVIAQVAHQVNLLAPDLIKQLKALPEDQKELIKQYLYAQIRYNLGQDALERAKAQGFEHYFEAMSKLGGIAGTGNEGAGGVIARIKNQFSSFDKMRIEKARKDLAAQLAQRFSTLKENELENKIKEELAKLKVDNLLMPLLNRIELAIHKSSKSYTDAATEAIDNLK